jgi:hypothetical protein
MFGQFILKLEPGIDRDMGDRRRGATTRRRRVDGRVRTFIIL